MAAGNPEVVQALRSVHGFAVAMRLRTKILQGTLYPYPEDATGPMAGAKGALGQVIRNPARFLSPVGAQQQIGGFPSTDMAHGRACPFPTEMGVAERLCARILGKIL